MCIGQNCGCEVFQFENVYLKNINEETVPGDYYFSLLYQYISAKRVRIQKISITSSSTTRLKTK